MELSHHRNQGKVSNVAVAHRRSINSQGRQGEGKTTRHFLIAHFFTCKKSKVSQMFDYIAKILLDISSFLLYICLLVFTPSALNRSLSSPFLCILVLSFCGNGNSGILGNFGNSEQQGIQGGLTLSCPPLPVYFLFFLSSSAVKLP